MHRVHNVFCSYSLTKTIAHAYLEAYFKRSDAMPGKGVSAFNYGRSLAGAPGSIWASTLAGGCDYEQHWGEALYGGYTKMPIDYLTPIEMISFSRLGTTKERAIGDQMRTPVYRGIPFCF